MVVLTAGWQSGVRQQLSSPLQTPSSVADAKFLDALPEWVTHGGARLQFARQHLAADDKSVQILRDACPQYWSIPFEKTFLPRHAFWKRRYSGIELLDNLEMVQRVLLLPKTDAQFAEAMCDVSDEGEAGESSSSTLGDFAAFARCYRKGGLEAARAGNVAVLSALLEHGWDPNTDRDRQGASALHYAAGHGHVECCARLCDGLDGNGLAVDDRAGDGATPLHWAVAGMTARSAHDGERYGFGTGGHRSTTEWLVRRGADLHATTVDGNSIVHWCAWAGQKPLLEWIARQVDQQPSHIATRASPQILIEAAANGGASKASQMMQALNYKGCSAAHWAASGGDLPTCVALAEVYGVDFALANVEGNTPLTKAIEHGREEVVQWLLTSGRTEAAIGAAAAYAARLSARFGANDTTHRISEMLQAYLVARHYLRVSAGFPGAVPYS